MNPQANISTTQPKKKIWLRTILYKIKIVLHTIKKKLSHEPIYKFQVFFTRMKINTWT